ncbi:hypothetical protein [Telluribacter humicola]|uniref:hypothetical protein n=1 Tax=Telluribacter humicola TaxID=1720261 RepID=UPI001A9701B4|nr:hypothetical protein [Telluribacter humicola]
MNIYKLKSVAALFLVLWLAGCSESIEPKPLTYTQLLTGTDKKAWTLTSFQIIDEGEESNVIPARNLFNNTCEADDQYIFYANSERRYEYVNGPTKCSSNEPDVLLTDQWTFTNANATLEFVFPVLVGNARLPFIVKTLTNTNMTLEIYLGELDASYRFMFTSATK